VPLLEREAQLALLDRYAGEARQGDGRLVFIAGEAGVGKSALVEQAQRGPPETTWCWGACDGLFTPRPLGPLFDIASTLGGELLELCRADAPREELFSALLGQVSAPGELHVLVVEDVHWADEATIDLLRFLGRRIRDVLVLLLATYRDEGLTATDPLRIALGDLAAQRSVRRISLPPLSAGAVGVLAGRSGLDPAALYQLTGGNPFYVSQAVQAGMSEVPASARDAVLARAARLDSDARAVLDAAALIGTGSSWRCWSRSPTARPRLSMSSWHPGCSPATGGRCSSAMRSRGSRWKERLRPTGAAPSMRGSWRRCRLSAATMTPGWRFTRRRPGTARRRCATRPRPPAGPPRWPRTVRRPPSSNGRCASPIRPIPPRPPGCTTASPTRHH